MDLAEVTNPHFALPVVVVVLLAVLVFAFGFKSPAPPPVFDFEDAKKPQQQKVKKRKTKETQKGKPQQNGHVLGVVKGSQEATKAGKVKNVKDKERIVTENGLKAEKEPKGRKKKQARDGLDLLGIDESLITHIEDNDAGDAGEWVHLPTKKEKKNRKKEELSSASLAQDSDRTTADESLNQHKSGTELSSESQQSTPLKKSKKAKNKTKVAKSKIDQAEPAVTPETVAEQAKPFEEVEAKPQRQSKDNKNKKEKGSDDTNLPVEVPPSHTEECPPAEEGKISPATVEDAGIVAQCDDESVMEIQTDRPNANNEGGNKSKKKSKKGSKAQTSAPFEEQASDTQDAKDQDKAKKTVEHAHPETTSKSDQPSLIATEKDATHITEKEENKENVGGSNVVFDELGDMWQDSKSQKKKRKARRDQ